MSPTHADVPFGVLAGIRQRHGHRGGVEIHDGPWVLATRLGPTRRVPAVARPS